ncbi:16S rRNA (guanine(527)-N(7))-methyltransferase RsmG [Roseobacter sinensis]|uniref:Ribosomal RNA small subunit methyltransferase G n=1 Tax=Roseobacter sinensis TaxID=2931391 RepID=A0ABT3B9Y6_9RHOB|nr:16S rRNA (guanine(527)-N(7))-methyltransferase RsmG [Roseobacter sp. WL0113]MCV3270014.1 16S rRNA (guanine(527)-N(7))-methyltransferase RsmG [Roseobacter sp. WL0113]
MTVQTSDVSRETLERLGRYHDLLLKWSSRINLISKSSTFDVWNRHIWDSAQVYRLADSKMRWADLGSGGGLPGVVLAILTKENAPDTTFTLVESDVRKATFLRTVIRELDLNATVIVSRIEAATPLDAQVLTARALADLSDLLSFAQRHLSPDGQALFLKGETWEKEVETARESWSFELAAHKSKTNPNAAILEVREIERV